MSDKPSQRSRDQIATDQITQLQRELEQLRESHQLMKVQCKISDEAFNFHLKRANDLMEKCNGLEARENEAWELLESYNNPETIIDEWFERRNNWLKGGIV